MAQFVVYTGACYRKYQSVTINDLRLKHAQDHIKRVCERFGAMHWDILDARNSPLAERVKAIAFTDLLEPPFSFTPIEIGCIAGYQHGRTVSRFLKKIGYGEPGFRQPDYWPRTPQEIVKVMGGYPTGRTNREIAKKRAILQRIHDECPDVTSFYLSKLLGIDHTAILHLMGNITRSRYHGEYRRSRGQDDVAQASCG